MTSPSRPDALPTRALETLRKHGVEPRHAVSLDGDVSLRRYFRIELREGESAILATYPPELGTACERFVRATRLLAANGIRSPEILLALCDDGLMLLEDLGQRTLFDLRSEPWAALSPYLQYAAAMISSIAALPVAPVRDLNPPLDHELLAAELARTWDLLLGSDGILAGSLPSDLDRAVGDMIERLTESEQLPCHRDFMARNLLPLAKSPTLAVIDHQDLRIGPKAYDLASLLNDSLYPPPAVEAEVCDALLGSSRERLQYHRAAGQRTLKIVGTFVGFARRGDSRHLPLVEPTLRRARHHLLRLPEMAHVGPTIESLWADLLRALADETVG